jgi:hypothetical protein
MCIYVSSSQSSGTSSSFTTGVGADGAALTSGRVIPRAVAGGPGFLQEDDVAAALDVWALGVAEPEVAFDAAGRVTTEVHPRPEPPPPDPAWTVAEGGRGEPRRFVDNLPRRLGAFGPGAPQAVDNNGVGMRVSKRRISCTERCGS